MRTSTISLTIQSPGRRMRSSVPSVKNTCEEQHAVARSCRCAGRFAVGAVQRKARASF